MCQMTPQWIARGSLTSRVVSQEAVVLSLWGSLAYIIDQKGKITTVVQFLNEMRHNAEVVDVRFQSGCNHTLKALRFS